MTERDAATIQTIREFQDHTRECAVQMMMNAIYIQRELTNVGISDELRQRTEKLCCALIGTKHDLVTEIFELDEVIEAGAGNVEVLRRIIAWCSGPGGALKMHEIVMALDAESKKDVMNVGAYLLVSESAVNILRPLHEMRRDRGAAQGASAEGAGAVTPAAGVRAVLHRPNCGHGPPDHRQHPDTTQGRWERGLLVSDVDVLAVFPSATSDVRSSVVACARARAENVGETTRRGSS